ncbi:MAG: hypothetical protein CMO82_08250 [Winogradskyella sp.]|nr:hypothetical protein [Winogradskyella sp.]|tara:strand:- start:2527 stop:3480 length:954 start_codon:yes stop_codon:yes gene_type:complete
MQKNRVLFITYDLSGYYKNIPKGLEKHFKTVESFNIATLHFKYKNIFQHLYSALYKIFKKQKLKNYYKLQPIIESTEGKTYDYIIIVRPDLFFDSQLLELKEKTDNFIAYYHDSINNIPRKKDVISYFDRVYSYEKKDVKEYGLQFLPNFIYLDNYTKSDKISFDGFTILSKDYRLELLKKIAQFFKQKNLSYKFLVQSDKEQKESDLVDFIVERQNNEQVLKQISACNFIIDVHKYGIQDGLTFRVFESLFFEKKLITSNKDIASYDFYDLNNIFIIDPDQEVFIPKTFLSEPYKELPKSIYDQYHYNNWIKAILK